MIKQIMRKYSLIKNGLLGDRLFGAIRSDFETICDHRQPWKVLIPLPDALMSAFAIFSVKANSLLQFDEETKNKAVRNNLRTIYKMSACSFVELMMLLATDIIFDVPVAGEILDSHSSFRKHKLNVIAT